MARDPEEARLLELQRRMQEASRAIDYKTGRGFRRAMRIATVIAVIVAGGLGAVWIASPWPLIATLKHFAAYPNCDAARAVGLAPARRGEPGYWPSHDRDKDGIACER